MRSDPDAEQAEHDEDDDEHEDQVHPVARPSACRDRWTRRVEAATTEISEEPENEQHDDEQLDESHMSASFADWVSTADAVRATPKKLEKHAALARYLGALDDPDLVIAARLLAGAPFPRRDERVLSVGWSALSDVLLERSGKSGSDMAESYQRYADLGDVAADLISESPRTGEPLSLADVAETFDRIAAARGVAPKRELLRALVARANADEARYLVKIVSGETRIGLREGLLEDAIARAFGRERRSEEHTSELQSQFHLVCRLLLEKKKKTKE